MLSAELVEHKLVVVNMIMIRVLVEIMIRVHDNDNDKSTRRLRPSAHRRIFISSSTVVTSVTFFTLHTSSGIHIHIIASY